MVLPNATRFRLPVKLLACLVLLLLLMMSLQYASAQIPSSPDAPTATTAPVEMTATALASDMQAAERILFLSSRDGSWRVYFINADGTNERLVTAKMGAMPGYEAVLSPDRKYVAFIGYISATNSENVYLINSEGTQVTLLMEDSSSDLYVTWLPNSKQIGFASYREEGMNIYVMNIDGGPITRLTPNDGSYNNRPLWSPNGKKIAFLSSRGGSSNLYVMDADGSNVRQITDDDDTYSTFSWSPDSESLVFSSSRDGRLNIYTLALDGGEADQLTYRGRNYSPSWSPDGTKIAFISDRSGKPELYTMKANGQALKPLTNGYFISVLCPTWMPDSQRIMAAGAPPGQSFPDASYDIYVINANGSGVMALKSEFNTDMLSHCLSLFG